MKTAHEILVGKATANNDGFMAGQVRWILEAMEDYKDQFAAEDNDSIMEQFNDHPEHLTALDTSHNQDTIAMQENNDTPAFPALDFNGTGDGNGHLELRYTGLTKREYIAAMAIQGLCAAHNDRYLVNGGFLHPESLVKDAIAVTDELLKQLATHQ